MFGKNRLLAFFAFSALLFMAMSAVMAEDVNEQQGSCKLNWSAKTIICTGKGSPNLEKSKNESQARLLAEQAAKMDALRNILENLKGVKISANITVGQKIEADKTVKTQVEGVLKNFTVVETRYYSDGGVEVDVKMSLDGMLTEVLLKDDLKKEASTNTNTGIIIVASGKKIVPVLSPKVLDSKGNIVYAAAMVSPAGAKNGIVAYHKTVNDAKKDLRVADNPIVINALEIKDAVDVVISEEDAKKLREANEKYNIFAMGKVVFVKD